MNEAFVLLNVDYKKQQNVIEAAKKIPIVKAVKPVYGMYDVIVILESSNMQDIKAAIDGNLHKIDGINNLTSLISVN
ncbi:MAG: Lrp/AsnC family transcriptional regulator [Thaumarchaeota archaeon]|nr:Lrp/AsnC family transcriptional regulator [Nitrososphaerota archaeon]